jgi:hypothetical protein
MYILKKEVAGGWGANPGPLNLIYFIIFTTLPLSNSGSPGLQTLATSVIRQI